MKTFLIAVFDNNYNALVKRLTVNSKDIDNVRSWCQEQSWSGETYMIEDEYNFLLKCADVSLEK